MKLEYDKSEMIERFGIKVATTELQWIIEAFQIASRSAEVRDDRIRSWYAERANQMSELSDSNL
jgi:hypothetical protein